MAEVAVFLAPGFEEIEAFTVVDYLRRANIKVRMVSVPEENSTIILTDSSIDKATVSR